MTNDEVILMWEWIAREQVAEKLQEYNLVKNPMSVDSLIAKPNPLRRKRNPR